MAQGKGGSSTKKGEKNSDRRNGKASKKNPGNPPKRCNGKSINGITITPKTQETIDNRQAVAIAKAKRASKRAPAATETAA